MGIFFLILSLFIFITLIYMPFQGEALRLLILTILFLLLLTIALGFMLWQSWVTFLAKYIYPPIATIYVLYMAYMLTVLSFPKATTEFVFFFIISFGLMSLILLLPVILNFYFPRIVESSVWSKAFFILLCCTPIVFLKSIYNDRPIITKSTKCSFSIEGIVIDQDTKSPVPETMVCARTKFEQACSNTGFDGAYKLKRKVTGDCSVSYVVQAFKVGYINYSEHYAYLPGTQNIDIEIVTE